MLCDDLGYNSKISYSEILNKKNMTGLVVLLNNAAGL